MIKIRLFKKTKRFLILSIVFIVFSISILRSNLLSLEEAKISCHYVYSNNSLPLLAKNSHLPSRSIFFHITSCKGNLTSRQYCAIESAAVTHPERNINVIFSGPVGETYLINFAELNKLKNVKFWRIHVTEFTKGTLFEEFVQSGVLKNCRWGVELTRDLLKYLTLSRWGGIYLDLDMVVARPLGSLVRNWVARHDDDLVGDEILAFSRDAVGRNVSEIAIKEMQSLLIRGDCSNIRPTVMTRVLQRFCSTLDPAYMSSATCNGFEVYGAQFFHPISENRARDYFIPGELEVHNAYTYHLWDHVSKGYKVMRSSPFEKLARRHCPATYKIYSGRFGF